MFAHQSNPKMPGQHHVPAEQVSALIQANISQECCVFVFHDADYQGIGERPVWPDNCVEHQQFLTKVIRMPASASVRDQSTPFSRELGSAQGLAFFQLQDATILGPKVQHIDGFKNIGPFFDDLFSGANRLNPSSVAVLTLNWRNIGTSCNLRRARKLVKSIEAQQALDTMQSEGAAAAGMYWGPWQDFVGLERPVVVALAISGTKDEVPQETWYSIFTRSSFKLCIVHCSTQTSATDFGHYMIGQANQATGLVQHTSGDPDRNATVCKGASDGIGLLEMDQISHVDPVVQSAAVAVENDMNTLVQIFCSQQPLIVRLAAHRRLTKLPSEELVAFLPRLQNTTEGDVHLPQPAQQVVAVLAELKQRLLDEHWANTSQQAVQEHVQQHGRTLQHASSAVKADRSFMMAMVQQDGNALQHASDDLKADKKLVMAAVQQDGEALQYASDGLKADRDLVMMAAVQQHGWALEYASDGLKADRDLVVAAVQQNCNALQYASDDLKADRDLVMAAVQQHGWTLQYASAELKADKDLVMAAVQQHGWALEYASDDLKADRDLVVAAVQQDGEALQYASDGLKADRDLVMATVQQAGNELQYASAELKADRDLVMAAVQQNGNALEYASDDLKADRDLVVAAVQQDGEALQYASDGLKADRDLVMAAVQQAGNALQYASAELKADRDLVVAAVQQNCNALQYASDDLKADRDLVMATVQQHGWTLQYASAELKADKDLVMAAVQQHGWALEYASDDLKADRDLVVAAVQQDGEALQYASDGLKADRDLVMATVQQHGQGTAVCVC